MRLSGLVVIQTSVIPFTPRSGGSDTAQAGKGGSAGKDSGGLSPGVGFPLPHNLLEEQHDAEVVFLSFFLQIEMLFTGPDSSSGSNAPIKHAKYKYV